MSRPVILCESIFCVQEALFPIICTVNRLYRQQNKDCWGRGRELLKSNLLHSARFSRRMPMSLSPRPEMLTITTSDVTHLGGALDALGYGVGGFEGADDAFEMGELAEGVERFAGRRRRRIRRGLDRAARRARVRWRGSRVRRRRSGWRRFVRRSLATNRSRFPARRRACLRLRSRSGRSARRGSGRGLRLRRR